MVSVSNTISRMAFSSCRRISGAAWHPSNFAEGSPAPASRACSISLLRYPPRNRRARRFSASGICLARMRLELLLASCPGRSSTRARCTSAGADTTTTASHAFSPPVSNSSGISSTTTGAPRLRASAQKRSSRASRTSGCTIASSRFIAAASPTTARAELLRDRPCRPSVVPGNAASIAAAASPS